MRPSSQRPPESPQRRLSGVRRIAIAVSAMVCGAVLLGVAVLVVDGLTTGHISMKGAADLPPAVAAGLDPAVAWPARTGTARAPLPPTYAPSGPAYLAALRAMDPGLAADEELAIRRGRMVCDKIINGMGDSPYSLREYTMRLFSDEHAQIDAGEAEELLAGAVYVICR
ncbi:hypothetical protein [Planobispora takensis]|uniref:DUF732 domain-containing protein n=1 Tax=Planobispora takensis TaxID=1367882 RepID=A0A8J3WWI8_9ACTN|nr:hypothetical protein [Planobispora takensis]GII04195.1 hypothetical protein Pta02_62030 [Planobispora takensis]